MPTVGIYVPIKVARAIAQRWQMGGPGNPDLQEVIRGACAAALDKEAGIKHPKKPFDDECEWAELHSIYRRCRHCGGS